MAGEGTSSAAERKGQVRSTVDVCGKPPASGFREESTVKCADQKSDTCIIKEKPLNLSYEAPSLAAVCVSQAVLLIY